MHPHDSHYRHRPSWRAALLWLSLLTADGALIWALSAALWDRLSRWPGGSAEQTAVVLETGSAAFGALLGSWLALALVSSALAELPGAAGELFGVLSHRVTPAVLRRTGAGLLSGALAVPVASPALASALGVLPGLSTPMVPVSGRGPTPLRAAGERLPDPDWVADPAPAGRSPKVAVRPGDCLWSIAARRLPPDASAQLVDQSWRRWYAANARVVGPDPDLIRPGQQLQPPTSQRSRR